MREKLYLYRLFSLLLFLSSAQLNSQTYCSPTNTGNSRSADYYVSKFSLKEINNISNLTANPYQLYTNKVAQVTKGQTYSSSVTFNIPNYNKGTINIWIDYNKNGTFESSEIVKTYTENLPASSTGVAKTFQITIPVGAASGETRVRVALGRGNSINACNLNYQAGEYEDYLINIKPEPLKPTAVCVGNLPLTLDVLGNVTITANDINNGSYDDYDTPGDLTLSIDRNTFNCNDVGTPQTVTLTVTDSDGLSSSCTTTVNVSLYSGPFVAPTIDPITSYCSYNATAPVMDYQCNETIVATTTDPTSFNSAGTYTIDWNFDNGSTIETSTQTITIANPATPTNVVISNISDDRADISWDSSETGPYRIRYRLNGTSSSWLETTSVAKSKTITGLDNGEEYEIQVKVDASCANYTTSEVFSTFPIIYCNTNLNLSKGNYYITNVTIGDINNTTTSSDPFYNYFDTSGTNIHAEGGLSGTISYSRQNYNDTHLVIWIDLDANGDFSANEEVFSVEHTGSATTNFTVNLNNISIPQNATLGKTRLRVGLSQNQKPSPCDFNHEKGEVEDYNVFIKPPDNTTFESALITQTYHTLSEKWIEITNINTTETLPTDTVILALYKNKSGDQTGILPTSTFKINAILTPGESVLIKNGTSTFNNISGTVLTNNNITDFDGENDILIVTKSLGVNAWENRFDVVSNIKDNTSMVRVDNVTNYRNTYNTDEWVNFVDDNLSTTTNPPERHIHAPLISEIATANNNANIKLGTHHINSVTRENNSWNNGFPDRTRKVLVNENYTSSSQINARAINITGTNSLTINNNPLIVSDSLTIMVNASLRLVGTSQLIQTHTGTKLVSGSGNLYKDQTSQLTNVYQSGNWSSPVSTNGFTFSIKDVIKDGTIPTSPSSNPPDINFTNSSTLDGDKTTPITISGRWLAKLINNVDYTRKINPEQVFMKPGEAWNMKSTGNGTQNYTFKGIPNDGEYTSEIGQNKLSLIGNPYPSAIDADIFIRENNSAISGTLYFYESGNETSHNRSTYKGGYATRVDGVGAAFGSGKVPTKYISVSQGFFVTRSSSGDGTIKFTNAQRVYNSSNNFFSKNKQAKNTNPPKFPVLRLGFEFNINEENKFHRQVAIAFRGLSENFDKGYDAEMFDLKPTDLSLQVKNSNYPFVITGINNFNNDLEIPLNVQLDVNRDVIFNVDALENINTPVYLIDRTTNNEYNISKESITLNLNAGIYKDRFFIKFKSKTLALEDEYLRENINTYIDNKSKELVIKNLKRLSIKEIKIITILGQEVFSFDGINNNLENRLQLSKNIKSGIYILKIDSEKGSINKKIFIPGN